MFCVRRMVPVCVRELLAVGCCIADGEDTVEQCFSFRHVGGEVGSWFLRHLLEREQVVISRHALLTNKYSTIFSWFSADVLPPKEKGL